MWPGYGDNMRVLKWILERVEGSAPAGNAHVFGVSPRYEDLHWEGLSFTREQFASVIAIDPQAWTEEMKLHDELFEQLAHGLPQELRDTKARIEQQLGR